MNSRGDAQVSCSLCAWRWQCKRGKDLHKAYRMATSIANTLRSKFGPWDTCSWKFDRGHCNRRRCYSIGQSRWNRHRQAFLVAPGGFHWWKTPSLWRLGENRWDSRGRKAVFVYFAVAPEWDRLWWGSSFSRWWRLDSNRRLDRHRWNSESLNYRHRTDTSLLEWARRRRENVSKDRYPAWPIAVVQKTTGFLARMENPSPASIDIPRRWFTSRIRTFSL